MAGGIGQRGGRRGMGACSRRCAARGDGSVAKQRRPVQPDPGGARPRRHAPLSPGASTLFYVGGLQSHAPPASEPRRLASGAEDPRGPRFTDLATGRPQPPARQLLVGSCKAPASVALGGSPCSTGREPAHHRAGRVKGHTQLDILAGRCPMPAARPHPTLPCDRLPVVMCRHYSFDPFWSP